MRVRPLRRLSAKELILQIVVLKKTLEKSLGEDLDLKLSVKVVLHEVKMSILFYPCLSAGYGQLLEAVSSFGRQPTASKAIFVGNDSGRLTPLSASFAARVISPS